MSTTTTGQTWYVKAERDGRLTTHTVHLRADGSNSAACGFRGMGNQVWRFATSEETGTLRKCGKCLNVATRLANEASS
jgi:hypothetical protein